jgi:hypothetical protein
MERRRSWRHFGAILVGTACGCARAEPPAWDAAPGSLSAAPLPATLPGLPEAAAADASDDAAPVPSVDPGTLAQTRDRPKSSGPVFEARMRALWDAVAADDVSGAMPAFFPVTAYAQVKAISNPESDWKRRLVANLARDIHHLHERLGAHANDARFVELDVASERARWVEPGDEGNKLGYWRVYGSKLRYDVGGTPGAFDVSSLISWRGEWYVVHLSGFK